MGYRLQNWVEQNHIRDIQPLIKEHGFVDSIKYRLYWQQAGGSTIDCAKAIAATALADTDDFWDLAEGKVSWYQALPVIAVPARQTAAGEFDIIAHLFDMNYFVNSEKYPLQFHVVEAVLKAVVEQLPVAVEQPENEASRSSLLGLQARR